MLKHIKDIRSPIAVAQQKLAARKAGSIASNNGNATDPSAETPVATSHAQAASNGGGSGTKLGSDRSARPSALTLPDYQGGPGPGTGTGSARAPSSGLLTTGLSPQPGWPSENSMLSPGVVDGKSLGSSGLDESQMSQSSVGSNMTGTTLVNSVGGHGSHGSHGSSSSISTAREIPASTGISYAVAIYPYMAEQDDEFDVVVYVLFASRLNLLTTESLTQGRYLRYSVSSPWVVGRSTRSYRVRNRRHRDIQARMGTRRMPTRNQRSRGVCNS